MISTYKITLNSLIISSVILFTGCQTPPQKNATPQGGTKMSSPLIENSIQPLKHAYDFHVVETITEQPKNIKQLAQSLKDFDIIFIGEEHSNHASHLFQMQLMTELHSLRSEQILSLEMFNRDQQEILNRYLDGEVGEVYLVHKTPAWSNYIASYRPLVEYAKQHFTPVIAANASSHIVRCIGREGKAYLDKLTEEESRHIAKSPFIDNEAYRKRYMEFVKKVRKLSDEGKEKSYLAQLSRDNTMAESIYQTWLEHPDAQIIHLNGSFHSDFYLGTVSALKTRAPQLKIAVIAPVTVEDNQRPNYTDEDLTRGQYIYLIPEQPEQYVDRSYRQKNHKAMFEKASQKQCH
jgi:uncharacterized iron-regulated protein